MIRDTGVGGWGDESAIAKDRIIHVRTTLIILVQVYNYRRDERVGGGGG